MSRKIFEQAEIFPLQPGTKKPLPGTRGFHDAICNAIIPPGYNIGCVPASIGLICIDLDPGHDEAWAAEHLPPTLTVKSPRGRHLYYRCNERFGNSCLGEHIDTRSDGGYSILPPSQLANGSTYEWADEREPVALPEGVLRLLRAKREYDNRPYDPDVDQGDDNESNFTKARMLLRNTSPHANGYNIACRLRRDIGLSYEAAAEIFAEWSDTLDWPWDHEKIRSVCRNAGRYGRGDQGKYAGAGVDAYDPSVTAPPRVNGLDNTAQGHFKGAAYREHLRINGINPDDPILSIPKPRVKLTSAAGTKVTNVKWLWHEWLPRGVMSLLAGRPGDGKSQIALSIAAIVTTGGIWPDGTQCTQQGEVLIWSSEDGWNTIVARFLAAGGDPRRFHRIDTVENRPFDPATDMMLLDTVLDETPHVQLVILDPIIVIAQAKAGETQNVRRAMQPTLHLIEKHGIALLGITHFAKGTQDLDLLERLIGSQAWGAQSRMVWITASNEETDKLRLIRLKSNDGPKGDGFDYATVAAEVPNNPGIISRRIDWTVSLKGPAKRLFHEIVGGDEGSKLAQAEAVILDVLPITGAPMCSTELEPLVLDWGVTKVTYKRARSELAKKGMIHAYPIAKEWYVQRVVMVDKYETPI